MNVERIKNFIAVLERADNLDMQLFQATNGGQIVARDEVAHSVEELHGCGNTACIAGYLAISPDFRNAGGRPNPMGDPLLRLDDDNLHGHYALAAFFDIPKLLAAGIVYDHDEFWEQEYDLSWLDVNKGHAVRLFNDILAGRFEGSEWGFEGSEWQ